MQHLYSFSDFLNEGKIEDIHAKFYAGMEATTFQQIVTADPTSITRNGETKKMGTYSKWLLKLFQDGKLLLEDLYKATEYLLLFDKLKAQKVVTGAEADINRYDSLPDLFKYIKTIGGTGEISKEESYLLNDRYYINQGEAEVFHEDDDYLIVIPRSLKASQFYAHNTEWCTRFPEMFNVYSGDGDLYIIIDKHKLNTDEDNRRMQFHFHSGQFMDMNDESLPQPVKVSFLTFFQHIKESWRLRYDDIGFYREERARVQLSSQYGVVDLEGNVVVAPKYDWVGYFSEGRASVTLNGKNGFIDLKGNEVVAPRYDWVGDYRESRVSVKLNMKWGVVDLDGNEVIPLVCDSVGNYNDGRVVFEIDGKYGVIDLEGNMVVPPKYNWIREFLHGRAVVKLNGKRGYIDLDGNETWD